MLGVVVTELHFRVLGPLEVVVNGVPVEIGAGKQRVLLAALLLHRNRVVSVEKLIDLLWDESMPADASAVVQKYVMRLRRLLPGQVIVTDGGGYRLVAPPDSVDLDRFEKSVRLAAEVASSGQLEVQADHLRAGLELWRGVPALSNVPSDVLQRNEVTKLNEKYLDALERRIDADLALAKHDDLVSELTALVHEHPLRERFWVLLMSALLAAGRRSEALAAYQQVTAVLSDELGIAPGPDLRAIHDKALHSDEAGRFTKPANDSRVRRRIPRQLPIAHAGFVGRVAQLDWMTDALQAAADGRAAPVVLLTGIAGIGKTALALQGAHRAAERFPDGQFYVDLQAHSDSTPLRVEEVLGQFVRTLGQQSETMPLLRSELIETFRTLVAGKRILVVLDNVGAESQVRDLLPGTAGCAVVVTSRNELAGLVVSPGVKRIVVPTLSAPESFELLNESLGDARAGADKEAMDVLIARCGGLALALRVAAAHLAIRPQLPVRQYVDHLRSKGAIVALGVEGDEQASLSAAFDRSYRWLSSDQQRLFRLVCFVPGLDFSAGAAAAMTGTPASDVDDRLEGLASASLLLRMTPGRYQLHDLIRAYGRARGMEEESPESRLAARMRLFEYYTALADAAAGSTISLSRMHRPESAYAAEVANATLGDLDDERSAIVAAVRDAAEEGPVEAAFHLADAFRAYLMLRRHAVDWQITVEAGLAAAQRAGSEEAIAAMLNSRGALHYLVGDMRRGFDDWRNALERCERSGTGPVGTLHTNLGIAAMTLGDREGSFFHLRAGMDEHLRAGNLTLVETTRENLTVALVRFGELEEAVRQSDILCKAMAGSPNWYRANGLVAYVLTYAGNLRAAAGGLADAAEAARETGDPRTELTLRQDLAACYLELGMVSTGFDYAQSNVSRAESSGFRSELLKAEDVIAIALLRRGDLRGARTHFLRALQIARAIGDGYRECSVLVGLSDLEMAEGDVEAAARWARQVVDIARRGDFRLRVVDSLSALSRCLARQGQHGAARSHAEEAMAIAAECVYPLGEAHGAAALAGAIEAAEGFNAARSVWLRSQHAYEAIESFRAGEVERHLAEATAPNHDIGA